VTKAALEDYKTAPISERLRAVLAFVEKLTLTPDAVGPADAAAARAGGASDDAIEDALAVMVLFNTIDRIADAFGFHVPDADQFRRMGAMLLKRGYLG
jgi:alkylhydroperoxidase family enzyme